MAVMRMTTQRAYIGPSKVVRKSDFRQVKLGCCAEYDERGLGAMSQGASIGVSVAATAASFIPVVGPVLGPVISMFGKLFGGGKSKKQKLAESMQRRMARAAGTFQAAANVLVNYPNSVENDVMKNLQSYLTTATGYIGPETPCEVIDAILSIDPNTFGKKKAIAAMRSWQANLAATVRPVTKCGNDWWNSYFKGEFPRFGPIDAGYQRLMQTQAPYSGPVTDISGRWISGGTRVTVTQMGTNFTMQVEGGGSVTGKFTAQDKIMVEDASMEAYAGVSPNSITWDGGVTWQRDTVSAVATPAVQAAPTASGQTTIAEPAPLPPTYMTPTGDGQAAKPLQAGIMEGSALGWIMLGGLFLLPFLFGGKKQGARRRRPAKGTTIIRRY